MRKEVVLFVIISALVFSAGTAFAQGTMADDMKRISNEWKYAFSKEGVKQWKPEFTVRYYAGFVTEGPMITGGIRVDEKRSLSLFFGQGDTYNDANPSDIYSYRAGVNFRRYWHLGKRKIFAIYSDLYAGAGYIYKISGKYQGNITTGEQWEVVDENVGDMTFVAGWQPGIRVRCYRNLHIFLGPTITTDCIGLHLGIGL